MSQARGTYSRSELTRTRQMRTATQTRITKKMAEIEADKKKLVELDARIAELSGEPTPKPEEMTQAQALSELQQELEVTARKGWVAFYNRPYPKGEAK